MIKGSRDTLWANAQQRVWLVNLNAGDRLFNQSPSLLSLPFTSCLLLASHQRILENPPGQFQNTHSPFCICMPQDGPHPSCLDAKIFAWFSNWNLEGTMCGSRRFPISCSIANPHTGPAKWDLKFHFSLARRGADNPKTSPQSGRTPTAAGSSSSHRWDVGNRWLRYCFTLGFTLSILAPLKSTLAYVLAPWITGKPVRLKKKKKFPEKKVYFDGKV